MAIGGKSFGFTFPENQLPYTAQAYGFLAPLAYDAGIVFRDYVYIPWGSTGCR